MKSKSRPVEVVPAILRKTFEGILADWQKIYREVDHIQIDITDGVFAGEGTYRELRHFKQLPESQKCELHLMIHSPTNFLVDAIDVAPARCVFHLESFTGTDDLQFVYNTLKHDAPQTERGLALNPESPNEWLDEYVPLVNYAMFMGYNPGWANQPINPIVYKKIAAFKAKYPTIPIAVDGHVTLETVKPYIEAGASILCANTAIFGSGDPVENYKQLVATSQS